MYKFLVKILALGAISLIVFVTILSKANGYTDAFYIRFTTPKQDNLVLGTSRAAQGLQPEVFKQILNIDIFNYAFTLSQSPYGQVYLNSIKKKLNQSSTNGLFIITVDPWSISSINENPNDITTFRENNLCLDNTTNVNTKPNYQYIFNNLSGKYAQIITNYNRATFLHENGWLEISSINMKPDAVNRRIESKIKSYQKNIAKYRFSNVRLKYLRETIEFLKNHGKVYIVRLPIHNDMMQLENKLMPDFDKTIKGIIDLSSGYYDMTPLNTSFDYTDGNHLHKSSGKKVSALISTWIKGKK